MNDYDNAVARWRSDARDLTNRRWRSDVDGRTFDAFTNGHFMLALSVESTELELLPKDQWRSHMEVLLRKANAAARRDVGRGALLSLAGELPPAKWPECDQCYGAGREDYHCERCDHHHECVCEYCESGVLVPPRTIVEIDGVLFDRRYVAEAAYFAAGACSRFPFEAAVTGTPDDAHDDPWWLTVRAGPRLGVVLALRRECCIGAEVVLSRKLETT